MNTTITAYGAEVAATLTNDGRAVYIEHDGHAVEARQLRKGGRWYCANSARLLDWINSGAKCDKEARRRFGVYYLNGATSQAEAAQGLAEWLHIAPAIF